MAMDTQSLEMGKDETMKCSVIILNWNGREMLKQYLPSVVEHTQIPDCEIVVTDNGSTDDSLEVLQSFPTVRTLTLDKNYGFAEGYNRAIRDVECDYVVLLNSDVEVTAGWLQPMVQYLDTHPDTVACQPKIRSWKQKQYFEHAGAAGGKIDRLFYPYCRGRILGYVEEDHGQYDTIEDIFWATGACLCIRRESYVEAGGLDADFFAHMEEIDLCWRLGCRGGKLSCIPQSVVYHLGGGALGYESPRKTYLNFRNNLLMIYKNLPSNHLAGVMLWRFVLDYAAALHLLLTLKPKNAWAVVKARWDYQRMRRTATFHQKRRENRDKATTPYPTTIDRRVILWDYYFKGMRK